jgi:cobalamin biosynthesis Mg chelatase CobN
VSAVSRPRTVLAALLLVATGLFAYAVLHERSLIRSERGESPAQLVHESAATKASETPAKRTSETAATKASETPAKRASETAATKASETPAKRASETAATRASERAGTKTSETPAKRASETAPNAGTVAATSTAHVETPAQRAREGRVLGVDLESTPMIALAIVAGLALAILAFSPLGATRAILFGLALGALAWSALDIREIVHQANESHTDLAIIAGLVAALHAAAAALAVWLARKPSARHARSSRPTSTSVTPG